jgi:hypothetical protein
LLDRKVDTVLEIYEGVSTPKSLPDFLPGNDFPLARRQEHQELRRLRLKPDLPPVLTELPRSAVETEVSKREIALLSLGRHRDEPAALLKKDTAL